MLSGLIGKKLGMTQVGDAAGRVQPVTVIQLGPCAVTQIKTKPTDGYEAVQVTYGKRKLSRVTQRAARPFRQGRGSCRNRYAGIRQRGEGELKLGQTSAPADVFKTGDARSMSRVFRRDMATQALSSGIISPDFPGSHGTHEYFRHGGSIGNRSYPGRVRKGLRMAGQMGNEKATIVNLRVVDILTDDNAIVVSGSFQVPTAAW